MKKIVSILLIIIIIFGGFVTRVTSENMMKTHSNDLISDNYNMVIISPAMFSSPLQTLIEHKNERNVYTILKTTEDIYNEYPGRDQPEQIKYFIKDAIESWNISYVLFVGGAAQIPGRYTHIYFDYEYQDEWIFLSELYFADIYDSNGNFSSWDSNDNDIFGEYKWNGKTDKLDLYPDVYVGRLACINENELNTCINKIINYENNEAYKQEWFTNLVVIGGDSLLGDEEHIDEGEYVNQAVIEILDGFVPTKIWASNGKLYHSSNINDAINEGAGFVFFNGHGDLSLWATHPHESSEWIPYGFYQNSHINSLTNDNKLPIIISDACYHCTYDVASDCFGWTFVKNPDGGCIAFLGGTDIDVSYGGEDIITKGIEKLCLIISNNYKNGDSTFGELWGNAITNYISSSEMDEIDYITVEEFQPFGDPSLQIASKSQPPLKPEKPQGPINNKIGVECTYNSSTTDPDGDNIYYMWDWGDGTYSKWLGPYFSGEKVIASHIWNKKGSYRIRVIAKDEHGVLSEWSESLVITMPKNKASFNSYFSLHLIERFDEFLLLFKHIIVSRTILNQFFKFN
jgi:hypothetical protein